MQIPTVGPRTVASTTLLLVTLLGATADAKRLALFRLDPLGIDAQVVAKLEGLLRLELGRLEQTAVPSGADVAALLKRQPALQKCTAAVACLSSVGRQLHVDLVIGGNVGGLAGAYVLNLKLVDATRRKEVRRIQETIGGRPDELIEAVRVAAYRLVAPERLRGALRLLATVAGAQVAFDGRIIGKTPLPLIPGLAVGNHVVRVSKEGYAEVVQPVEIPFQKTAEVVVRMELPHKGNQPQEAQRPLPWYTRWWFWTVVGVVAAGVGAGISYGLSSSTGINCEAEPSRCGL